jgi:hypothetical protein
VLAYNTLIIGAGASGIGMHQDGYDNRYFSPFLACYFTTHLPPRTTHHASLNYRCVSTYLTLGTGHKHVVMLPPSEEVCAILHLATLHLAAVRGGVCALLTMALLWHTYYGRRPRRCVP